MEDIDKMVTEVSRKAVKEFLENLMNTERDVFLMENNGQKNGYYRRSMKTRMGEISNLSVHRDRDGSFQTAVFEPYSRSIGIDELILIWIHSLRTVFREEYIPFCIHQILKEFLHIFSCDFRYHFIYVFHVCFTSLLVFKEVSFFFS